MPRYTTDAKCLPGSSPKSAAVESGKKHGLQAPCATVDLYSTTISDTVKLQGGMVTELDYGLGNVTSALKRVGMWVSGSVSLACADA